MQLGGYGWNPELESECQRYPGIGLSQDWWVVALAMGALLLHLGSACVAIGVIDQYLVIRL